MEPINLHELAEQAMLARGLLPAFSPEALHQAEAASSQGPDRSDPTSATCAS
jgi:exoribonuclease-2